MPEGDSTGMEMVPQRHLLNTAEAAFARGEDMVQFHTGADRWPPQTALAAVEAMENRELVAAMDWRPENSYSLRGSEVDLESLFLIVSDGSRRGLIERGINPDFVGKIGLADAAAIEFSKRVLTKNGFEVVPPEAPTTEEDDNNGK